MVLNPSTYSSDLLQVIKKQTRFLMLVFPSMKGKICRREEKKQHDSLAVEHCLDFCFMFSAPLPA
jgi:hypothetical protein